MGASHEEIFRFVRIEFRDFEDCLQDKCAKNVSAKYIITRNVKDFNNSDVLAVCPEDFLKVIDKGHFIF